MGTHALLRVVAAIALLGGCSGDDGMSRIAEPVDPPQESTQFHGRYLADVYRDGEGHFADALLTAEGAMRIYIAGPMGFSGVFGFDGQSSVQFVGSYVVNGETATAIGHLVGQWCAVPLFDESCTHAVPAEIRLRAESSDIVGEITVEATGGVQVWPIAMERFDLGYERNARASGFNGQYREREAEFATEGDTALRIDSAGLVFFQAPRSGCTGNGALTPHGDGAFDVYDVDLVIENCTGEFAHLNGAFEGLATHSPHNYWDYGSEALRAWLSTAEGGAPPVAMTLFGSPM